MAYSIARTIEEEVTCPVCLDYFVEPKILPQCGHVVCKDCLERLLRRTNSVFYSRTDICPECRKEIGIRKDAVGNLKTNFRLQNVAEGCRRDSRMKGRTDKANLTVDSCRKHPKEKVLLYCIPCNALVCQECLLEDHNDMSKQHHIIGVAKMCKDQKTKIQVVLDDQRTKVEWGKDVMNKLEEEMELVNESLKREDDLIAEFTKQRIEEIEKEDHMLHVKLKQAFSPKLEQIQRKIAETREEIQTAESIHENIQESMAKLTNSEYVSKHETFLDQLKSVQVHRLTVTPPPLPLPVAKFVRKQSGKHKSGRVVIMEHETWKAKVALFWTYIVQMLILPFSYLRSFLYYIGQLLHLSFPFASFVFVIIMQDIVSFSKFILMTFLAFWNYSLRFARLSPPVA